MAGDIIRPSALPSRVSPVASEVVPSDNGASVGGVTLEALVNAGRPLATQAEAEAGVQASHAMTPLTSKQQLYALGDIRFASAAQGAAADGAVKTLVAGANTNIDASDPNNPIISYDGSAVADGDRGDIVVSGSGLDWVLSADAKSRIVGVAADRAALSAMDGNAFLAVNLMETGRKGLWMWSGADLSASVATDPQQGLFVAPLSDGTGASGAWERQYDGAAIPRWFGAKGDGTTNDTPALTACFDAGVSAVDGLGRPYKLDTSLTLPVGLRFENFMALAGTAGMNVLRVNDRNKITGTIVGTGTTNIVERGIYPAVDSVVGVKLDVVIKDITVGIQAETVSGGVDQAKSPSGWYGRAHFENIVGLPGASEGYGLLGTIKSSNIKITGKNIRRHLLYLAAGAIDNFFDVDGDGCGNFLVQINTFSSQPASERNTVRIKSRNLTEDIAGQSGPCAIVGKSHRNTIILDAVSSGNDNFAAIVQGTSGGPYPTGNKIIANSIAGQFKGTSVIRLENQDGTIVTSNTIDAYAANEVIGMRYAGTYAPWHGGYVEGNLINALTQNCVGIYNEITQATSYIGPNRVINNGTAARVSDGTGGKRQGFSRSVPFSGTSPSTAAAGVQDTAITLSEAVSTARSTVTVSISGMSASYFENAWVGLLSRSSETNVNIRAFNGGVGAKTISFAGVVFGD